MSHAPRPKNPNYHPVSTPPAQMGAAAATHGHDEAAPLPINPADEMDMAYDCVFHGALMETHCMAMLQMHLADRKTHGRPEQGWYKKAHIKENFSPVIEDLAPGTRYFYLDAYDRILMAEWHGSTYDQDRAKASNIFLSSKLAAAVRDVQHELRRRLNIILFGKRITATDL